MHHIAEISMLSAVI